MLVSSAESFDDPSLPQVGDRAIHHDLNGVKTRGTITTIHKNGRIGFTPNDTIRHTMSLPRSYQTPVNGKQWGLVFVK